jgi:hypothetical protein
MGMMELVEATFPWSSALMKQKEDMRIEGGNADETGRAWREQALQQRTWLNC